MMGQNHLMKAYKGATRIPFDDNSRFVMMSDCHRGDGSLADNFVKNQTLYYAALSHYYREQYTYIELGDGEELWENSEIVKIFQCHKDVYTLLSRFHHAGRCYFLYGNHDINKKNIQYVQENYRDASWKNLVFREALILEERKTGNEIFLLHGHQVDPLNSTFWKLSRFLVKHLVRPLELFGFSDPTSASQNNNIRVSVERKLVAWTIREKKLLIAGHTHRPVFPKPGKGAYFNDGCSVFHGYITAIEIHDGDIALVKWLVKAKRDGTLYAAREVIEGPHTISSYIASFAN